MNDVPSQVNDDALSPNWAFWIGDGFKDIALQMDVQGDTVTITRRAMPIYDGQVRDFILTAKRQP